MLYSSPDSSPNNNLQLGHLGDALIQNQVKDQSKCHELQSTNHRVNGYANPCSSFACEDDHFDFTVTCGCVDG